MEAALISDIVRRQVVPADNLARVAHPERHAEVAKFGLVEPGDLVCADVRPNM